MSRHALFETHRRHLRALAYRMLGSRAEAEDLVQDAWLRWEAAVTSGTEVEHPRAWLSRVATHLCLDRLQSARARREEYVGVWLPEPLVDEAAEFDAGPQARAEYAQDVSIAFMLALERLTALERAAFLLHDVFDLDFPEIASRLGRSTAACRQLASRARSHIQAGQARVEVGQEEREQLFGAFARALRSGDVEALTSLLTEDAVFLSDGGGRAAAVPKPLYGPERIAKALTGFARRPSVAQMTMRTATINGLPGGVVLDAQGQVVQTIALRAVAQLGGRVLVSAIYVTRNPDKLRHVRA